MALPVPGLIPSLHDAPLRDRDGLLLGIAQELLCDAVTHRPAWFVVGLAAGRRRLPPAGGARHTVDGTCLAVAADAVRACPAQPGEIPLAAAHYGLRRFAREATAATPFTSAGPALDGVRAA
jgi:hypothetical protein